jgi:hypothetical protein
MIPYKEDNRLKNQVNKALKELNNNSMKIATMLIQQRMMKINETNKSERYRK